MKITLNDNYEFKKIEFCCGEMGELVMQQYIRSHPHSDHYPVFYVTARRVEDRERMFMDMTIKYCPFCGAKIRGEYING